MNFEDELSKFKPSLEIDDVEEALYEQRTEDVVDLIQDIVAGNKGNRNQDRGSRR